MPKPETEKIPVTLVRCGCQFMSGQSGWLMGLNIVGFRMASARLSDDNEQVGNAIFFFGNR